MVLHDRGEHDVVGSEPHPVREVIDRFGRVPADDRDVTAGIGATRKAQHRGTRLLVSIGRTPGLVPGASVHARVPRQKVLYPRRDRRQCARGRRGIEVQVTARFAIDARDQQLVAYERHGERDLGFVKIRHRRCLLGCLIIAPTADAWC